MQRLHHRWRLAVVLLPGQRLQGPDALFFLASKTKAGLRHGLWRASGSGPEHRRRRGALSLRHGRHLRRPGRHGWRPSSIEFIAVLDQHDRRPRVRCTFLYGGFVWELFGSSSGQKRLLFANLRTWSERNKTKTRLSPGHDQPIVKRTPIE